MFRFHPVFLILVLAIGRVASQAMMQQCEGSCEVDMEMSCDAVALLYDFTGDCCSLTTNGTGVDATCILVSNSNCTQIGRIYQCTPSGPDAIGCVSGLLASYTATDSKDECPESEIDVLGRKGSSNLQWTNLSMVLTGVTEMSEDDIASWESVTSGYIITYYMNMTDGSDVSDVVGYVRVSNTSETETGDILVTYFQQSSWRTDDKTFDPTTLTEAPFTSKDGVATYIQNLNDAGISATEVTVMPGMEFGPTVEGGPTVSPAAGPTAEEGPTASPAASPTAGEEGPTASPVAGPTAGEEEPTASPVAGPTAGEEEPTSSTATGPTAGGEKPPAAAPTAGEKPPNAKPPTAGGKPASAGVRVTSLWYGMFMLVGIIIL